MNKYLHLGYPKTGTTTLQEVLFENIGKDIIYLGRPFKKKYYQLKEINYAILGPKDLSGEIINNFKQYIQFFNKDILFSSEGFTNYTVSDNIFKNIESLNILFGSDTKILIVIRKQDELMYSFYNEFIKFKDINSWVKDVMSREYFNYYQYYMYLKDHFNNVFVLVFEDMIYDLKRYASLLSRYLDNQISKDKIVQILNKYNLNKKSRSNGYDQNISLLDYILYFKRKLTPLSFILNNLHSYKFITSKLKKISIKKDQIRFDSEIRTSIINNFSESNKLLDEKLKLGLQKYDYY